MVALEDKLFLSLPLSFFFYIFTFFLSLFLRLSKTNMKDAVFCDLRSRLLSSQSLSGTDGAVIALVSTGGDYPKIVPLFCATAPSLWAAARHYRDGERSA